MEKKCNTCGCIKPLIDFVKRGGGKYKNICKRCHNDRSLANLKADQNRLEKKREYDRIRVKTVAREANILSCRKYQAKVKSIKQGELLERQLLKGSSCKIHWYNCTRCNSLKYIKGRYNPNEICKACINIGSTWIVKSKGVVCPVCNKTHIAKYKNTMCFKCAEYNNVLCQRIAKSKRKARIRKATVSEAVNSLHVFKRDKYKCKFCGVKVQKKDVYADDAAELDHIIPLSKGGHHAYYNCQTLCRKCNQSKSNKLLGQLLLSI